MSRASGAGGESAPLAGFTRRESEGSMSKARKAKEAADAEAIRVAIAGGADPRRFVPVGLIRYHVGNLHVGTPYREIRDDIDARARRNGWEDISRRYAIKVALQAHAENRGLYRAVMTGRFGGGEGAEG